MAMVNSGLLGSFRCKGSKPDQHIMGHLRGVVGPYFNQNCKREHKSDTDSAIVPIGDKTRRNITKKNQRTQPNIPFLLNI